jgi:dTDP-glucose 4,6-dehydratase
MLNQYPNIRFVNIDKLDYCAREKNVIEQDNYIFIKGDICDGYLVLKILNRYNIDHIVHFAAYSHVDNSFDNSIEYTKNNVLGTHYLLESSRIWGKIKKFIHVSTDEVYGDMPNGTSLECSILSPTNPYAASKAAAEMLVLSYQKSFNMPIIITRGNNVYGHNQYPEKLIPKFITSILNNIPCTIHGSGTTKRNFIHCLDVAKAFETILNCGQVGEIYNIGSNDEYSVLEIYDKLKNTLKQGNLVHIKDREFNDTRYSVDITKLLNLGWKQEISFNNGLESTIKWYTDNLNWYN